MKISWEKLTIVTDLWNRFSLPVAARLASFLSLPIEGGFWAGVFPESWYGAALALPFVLDLIADLLVYKYGRIQLSVSRGTKKWKASRRILIFVVFNAIQSWGTSAWQLTNTLDTSGTWAPWLWPLLFAFVQPLIGFGVAYSQAVQDGKYDEEPKEERIQEPDPEPVLIDGQPNKDWWVEKVAALNGQGRDLTYKMITGMIKKEYTKTPSRQTIYNWLREAKSHV